MNEIQNIEPYNFELMFDFALGSIFASGIMFFIIFIILLLLPYFFFLIHLSNYLINVILKIEKWMVA